MPDRDDGNVAPKLRMWRLLGVLLIVVALLAGISALIDYTILG